MHRGVRSQLEALRSGFNTVFPMDKLGAFTPDEVCCNLIDINFYEEVFTHLVNVPFADEDSPMWRSRPSVLT